MTIIQIISVLLPLALTAAIHDGFICSNRTIEKIKSWTCVIIEVTLYIVIIMRFIEYASPTLSLLR